jgi:hypothetical protein
MPAVLTLMNSSSAIWRLVRPAATRASTSCSRRVRPSRSAGDGSAGGPAGAAAGSAVRQPAGAQGASAPPSSSARPGPHSGVL